MIVRCAWCGKTIDQTDEVGDRNITHGICEECAHFLAGNSPKTWNEFINELSEPVIAFDSESRVITANSGAIALTGMTLDTIQGSMGGDVMNCAYARLPEGCGHTVHCAGCTIRNNVTHTYETGESLQDVPAYVEIDPEQPEQRLRLKISTEKVNNLVLLRIDQLLP